MAAVFTAGVCASVALGLYARRQVWRRPETASSALRATAAELPGGDPLAIPRVVAPRLEEPAQVYELRAAVCALARSGWNASVVVARDGAVHADAAATRAAGAAAAAVDEAVMRPVTGAAHSARAGAADLEARARAAVSGAVDSAASSADAALAAASKALAGQGKGGGGR